MQLGVSDVKSSPGLNPIAELGLLVSSAVLFFLSFPNPINVWGFGVFGFIALIPLFILFNRTSWPRLMAIGPLFGFVAYLLFNYWLGAYHPLAIFIVPAIMAGEFLLLAIAFRLIHAQFPRFGYLLQTMLWVSFEFIKTQGFLGYPYGLIGYSQYLFLPLASVSSLTGIWGVSALVVFPSVFVAWRLSENSLQAIMTPFLGRRVQARVKKVLRRPLPLLAWVLITFGTIVVAQFQRVDWHDVQRIPMVLVQQNIDPWIGGTKAYAESLDRLIRQSDLALSHEPDVRLVVWSETSFVPAIAWHERYRADPERYALVKKLKDYFAGRNVPFVLGNGEAELWKAPDGQMHRRDFNAVLLFRGAKEIASYRKNRLVPFTESFPYRDWFPWLYDLLVANDTSFWAAGTEFNLIEAGGVKYGTPICFEDSFGYISREFVNRGADVILNLSNDSWSKSVPAAMQHLAMASFRAHENQRSVVRSTNGGMSALITPDGGIVAMNAAFTESWMRVDVPVVTGVVTFYDRYGDWFALLAMMLGATGLLWALVVALVGRFRGVAVKTD